MRTRSGRSTDLVAHSEGVNYLGRRMPAASKSAFVSLVFQEAPRNARVLKFLGRPSEERPFCGQLTRANGGYLTTTIVTELPRTDALQDFYLQLDALLPVFELYVVYDDRGDLIEVQILRNGDTERRLDTLEVSETGLDTALSSLLSDHAPFVVVHAGPTGSRLNESPRSWLNCIETGPIELFSPQEVSLGTQMGLHLSSWCITQLTHQCRSCARPGGYILSGPSRVTRMTILSWLLSPSKAPPDAAPMLFPSTGSLVVVPESRVHLWKDHLGPDVLIAERHSLAGLKLLDLLCHAYVLVTKEALVDHALQCAESRVASAAAYLRSRGITLVRRARSSGTPVCEIDACFHAVHFQRLVVEDVSCDMASVSSTIHAYTRVGLSEDGQFFADRSYLPFTDLHPDLLKLENTGCVHRSLEMVVYPKASLNLFPSNPVVVGPVPATQLMSLTMSAPSFLSRLTPDALGQFTEYGRGRLRQSPVECPICFSNKGRAFMPCGHAFCYECSEKLPVESISMAIQRTPVVIRQCLIRRCPICRSRCQHIYSKRVRAQRRQKLVAKLVRGATTSQVWVCSHWTAALDELAPFVQSDTKDVTMHRIDQSAIFPASGEDITVVWVHPPCFYTPNLDMLNMTRAYNAAGHQYRNLHIVCADAAPEINVLNERFRRASKRSVIPRE